MNITATSESNYQEIARWTVTSGSYSWYIRVVAWISQNQSTLKTTMYHKWQIGADNYWPYWNDSHEYTVSLGGTTNSCWFNLPQKYNNDWQDMSSAQSITVSHDSTTGEYSGTISFTGSKPWEAFSYSETCTFPKIAIPEPTPEPEPEDDESAPIVNDSDGRFYILADDLVLYSVNEETHIVLEPTLTLELNQASSLDFTLPPGNALYNTLNKLRTTIEVRQGNDILFRGRILNNDIDFYNRKSVHCEDALAFLGDTLMAPFEASSYPTIKDLFKAAIDSHYEQVPNSTPKRRIKYVRCNMSGANELESDEYVNTIEIISELISTYGGFLKMEYYENGTTGLSYLNSYDHTSSQIIDFGKNLLDISQFVDASEIYTSVVCLGKKDSETGIRVNTGSGSNFYIEDQNAINLYGRIIKTFTYDDIESSSELRTIGQALLRAGINSAVTITMSAVDLHIVYPEYEKIRIGDAVRIRSTPHGIDGYFQCSKIVIDMHNPDNTKYTFGASIKALTDSINKK